MSVTERIIQHLTDACPSLTSEIASALACNKRTVENGMQVLLKQGVVIRVGEAPSAKGGRPGILVDLAPEVEYIPEDTMSIVSSAMQCRIPLERVWQ